jgi:hypothetical protein
MALEVIRSGFGRTGTASMKLALQQLPFGPCHHMDESRASCTQAAPPLTGIIAIARTRKSWTVKARTPIIR